MEQALVKIEEDTAITPEQRVVMVQPANAVFKAVKRVLTLEGKALADAGLAPPTEALLTRKMAVPPAVLEEKVAILKKADEEALARVAKARAEREAAEREAARRAEEVVRLVIDSKREFKHHKAEDLRVGRAEEAADRKALEGGLAMEGVDEESIHTDNQSSDGFDAAEAEREATRSVTNSPALPPAELAESEPASSRRNSGVSSTGR